MAKHPPIPPNCQDILTNIDDCWCFRESGENDYAPLDLVLAHYLEYKDRQSGVARRSKRTFKEIVCRCRCAWLDLARKLSEEGSVIQFEIDAKSNAEKWRNWGQD